MAITILQTEAIPASYPPAPVPLSTEAALIETGLVWQRIEAYISRRFTTRQVVWIVEGTGEWVPPLSPATVTATEVWIGSSYEAVSLSASPTGGYTLTAFGPYRFTANVGGGTVPQAINEAYRRLAEYFADVRGAMTQRGTAGVGQNSFTIGELSESQTRAQSWAGRAMELSGAGDLLRPWR